jgi:hypothetical protein
MALQRQTPDSCPQRGSDHRGPDGPLLAMGRAVLLLLRYCVGMSRAGDSATPERLFGLLKPLGESGKLVLPDVSGLGADCSPVELAHLGSHPRYCDSERIVLERGEAARTALVAVTTATHRRDGHPFVRLPVIRDLAEASYWLFAALRPYLQRDHAVECIARRCDSDSSCRCGRCAEVLGRSSSGSFPSRGFPDEPQMRL